VSLHARSFSGFWEAYEHVRDFVHAILRRELVKNPTTVYFTGHSLGGALATFAALDVTLHTVPRVNAWLKHQEK
jgi:putative lipase involved disintegration of autophagic bodies